MENNLFNLEEINEVLDNNRDPYFKEIGDRVNILDYSSCTHMNGMELDSDQDEEMQFNAMAHFIVIDNRLKQSYDAYYITYRQDLVIVNPLTNKQFRISSGHVKLK
jgi:hypothetical protein